ncbi:hypothetical protein [Ralstonia solanacearum]|uniref:hypothetical protein n=1 Tax=Ralstonia solanacearum TaxID=305 RepID=UPI001F0897C7|nr:hypothetical protein [Ralstonia solanacearum]
MTDKLPSRPLKGEPGSNEKSKRDRQEIFKKLNRRYFLRLNWFVAAMQSRIGVRTNYRDGPVFRLSSIVVDAAGNKGTFVPVSKVDAMIGRRTRFLFLYF